MFSLIVGVLLVTQPLPVAGKEGNHRFPHANPNANHARHIQRTGVRLPPAPLAGQADCKSLRFPETLTLTSYERVGNVSLPVAGGGDDDIFVLFSSQQASTRKIGDTSTTHNASAKEVADNVRPETQTGLRTRKAKGRPEAVDSLIPAFRFKSSIGIVECLMRGGSLTLGTFVMPAVTYDPLDQHYTATLPRPQVMQPGLYALRCMLLYGEDLFNKTRNLDFRWPTWRKGAQFIGEAVPPATPRVEDRSRCRDISQLLMPSAEAALHAAVSNLTVGACPGVVVEGSGRSWKISESIFNGPPAVVRISERETISEGNRHSLLPRCVAGGEFGRWLPIEVARPLVTNGHNIPPTRMKYWVPYECRATYWDISALKLLAASGQSSTCEGQPPLRGCLQCNLSNLRKVVFTGASTTSALMAAMRQHVLGESKEASRRDKQRDHENAARGTAIATSTIGAGNLELEFVVMYQLMPRTDSMNRSEAAVARRRQIRDLTNDLKPSAFVVHVGLHELCGAYGPEYPGKHAPCANRRELMETYSDYGDELKVLGLHKKSLFRSLMGSFPDAATSGPWRWQGFADCLPVFSRGNRGDAKGNPCPAVMAPLSNVIHAGRDATKAWNKSEVRVVDAFTPFHASPTSDIAAKDGMHLGPDCDEALAVNQAIMNALCASS